MSRGLIFMLACAVVGFASPTPCHAQLPPQVRVRANALANNLRWLQFRVVSGRVTTGSQLFGRSVSSSTKSNGREESLSINLANGVPVFRYELGTADERVTIAGTNGEELTLRRDPRGDSTDPLVELVQPARGRLTLSIQHKDDLQPRLVTGATLWHLALAEPVIMQQEVLPLVEMLQPDWKLAELAEKLPAALQAAGGQSRVGSRKAWSALLAELTSDRYAAREAADRKLRSAGASIAPYLAGLDHRGLTAEQRVRVRRIVAAVSRDTLDDSVEHVVAWLAWDAKAWYLLLSRDDEALRQAAAAQLAGLLDEPLDFDPAADAATRQQQLERLRPLFELPPAAEAADEPAEDE